MDAPNMAFGEQPTDRDGYWMRLALAEAERGRGGAEPNPLVGAVIVDPEENRLIALGYHDRFGGPHAEVVALRAAGEESRNATLYVTLEPCCHHGKTPPCTQAVLKAGISRVVAAMADPFPKVAGGGMEELRANGVPVVVGVEEGAARLLNAPYLKLITRGRPFVTAKWAMTLDGRTACASGDSKWISGERSRAIVHEIRGRMDGILVGVGTVLADDPLLTARPAGRRQAARIVLDRQVRTPLESRLVQTAREVPVIIATGLEAPAERVRALADAGCEVLVFPDSANVPIPRLLDELGTRRLTNLLVEGGGATLGAFLDSSEVDAVEVFVAPCLEGGSHGFSPARGRGVQRMADALRLAFQEVQVIDHDVRIRGFLRLP